MFKDSTNTSHIAEQYRQFALPVLESELEKATCGVVPVKGALILLLNMYKHLQNLIKINVGTNH